MNDVENASVFGLHFDRVFNNNRPIDWPVLEKIKQIYVMEELDTPFNVTRSKIHHKVRKLKITRTKWCTA